MTTYALVGPLPPREDAGRDEYQLEPWARDFLRIPGGQTGKFVYAHKLGHDDPQPHKVAEVQPDKSVVIVTPHDTKEEAEHLVDELNGVASLWAERMEHPCPDGDPESVLAREEQARITAESEREGL